MSLARRLLAVGAGSGGSLVAERHLRPTDTITGTKSGSNPTFNFDAIPETITKVGSTYYAVYMSWVESPNKIRLATASSPAGPWTGAGVIYTFADVSWAPGTSNGIYAPEIIVNGGTYYLFYSINNTSTGADGHIGYATASAITGPYTDHGSAILSPGASGSWDSLRVSEPSVFYHDGTWYMAYMGEDTDFAFGRSERVGIATASSPTGPWTKAAANPLIDWGAGGEWDDSLTADPFIWYEDNRWWIWYSGGGNDDGSGSRPWSLGLAYSTSPTTSWTKHASNPIVSHGGAGTWEEKASWRGSVYRASDGTYHVIYGGLNNGLGTAKGGNAVLTIS